MNCKGNQLWVLKVLERQWPCWYQGNWGKLCETSRDSSLPAQTCRFLSNPWKSDVHHIIACRENNAMNVYSWHVMFQLMVCILEVTCAIQGNIYSINCLGCSSDHNRCYRNRKLSVDAAGWCWFISLMYVERIPIHISSISLPCLLKSSCRHVGQWNIKSKALHKESLQPVPGRKWGL
jgi:hypothetical protein